MKMEALTDLFHDELKDIYDAEHQLMKALPKMAKKANSDKLRESFEMHMKQTEEHISRLEKVFDAIGKKPSRKTCEAMKGLVEEGEEIMKEVDDPELMDAALIAAAQKTEHYEMASYGCLRTWADIMDLTDAKKLLQKTLDEEGETDKKLTRLAETGINVKAAA